MLDAARENIRKEFINKDGVLYEGYRVDPTTVGTIARIVDGRIVNRSWTYHPTLRYLMEMDTSNSTIAFKDSDWILRKLIRNHDESDPMEVIPRPWIRVPAPVLGKQYSEYPPERP